MVSPARLNATILEQKRGHLVLRLLYMTFSRFRDPFFQQLARRGHPDVDMTSSLILRNLDWHGTAMAEIVRRAGVSRQIIAKVVRDLERSGYVRVSAAPTHARHKVVTFTARGRTLVRDILEVADAVEREMARILGRRRLEVLRRALQVLCSEPLRGAAAARTATRRARADWAVRSSRC